MVYLKLVEAKGFKSFADKTIVKFDTGVTAIVGPNGSGKSNITDAIKWVLGEQSAKSLRGSKMEDVIFSGAKNKESMNFCEVALVLDNSAKKLQLDHETIEIKRKLYRSGDSEFYINQQKVRLKDITELFLDSGLGKDAFSIISQGKVDEILNAKPEDRRHLIEEAAGVLKYKKRKKETVERLDETMSNLNRVHDIIYDLKGRLEPLEIEASIAKEYLSLVEEMKDADIQVTAHEIEVGSKRFETIQSEIQSFTELAHIKKDKATVVDSKVSQLKTSRNETSLALEEAQQQFLNLTEQMERKTGEINVKKERLNHMLTSNEASKSQIDKLNRQYNALNETHQTLLSQYEALNSNLKSLKQQLKMLNQPSEHSEASIVEAIEQTRNEYFDIYGQKTALLNEIKTLEWQIEQFEKEAANKREHQADISQNFKEKQIEFDQLNHEIESITKKQDTKRAEYKYLLQNADQLKQQYKTTEEKYYQALKFIEQLKLKQNRLEQVQNEFQGYYTGVRNLLKEKHQLKGIHNAVLELIHIDTKYAESLEVALGGSLQHIVVDDEVSGRNAIRFLNEKKLGRATFLPLTVIKPRKLPIEVLEKIKNHPGYIDVLAQLIQSSDTYRSIVENLAGTTIICNTLKDANEIARLIQYKYRIVTLDGNIVNPGGSMSGGSKVKGSNLLKQREELQDVVKKLSTFEKQTQSIESELQTLKQDLTETEFQLSQSQREGESYRDQIYDLNQQLSKVELELNQMKQQNASFAQFEQEKALHFENQQTLNKLNSKVSTFDNQLSECDERIVALTEQQKMSQVAEKDLNNQKYQLNNEINILNERLQHLNQQKSSQQNRLQEIKDEIQMIQSEDKVQLVDNLKETIASESKEVVTLTEEKAVLEETILSNKSTLAQLQNDIEEKEKQYNELMRQMTNIETGIGELKSEYSKLDVQLENKMTHLSETYQHTFESALQYIQNELKVIDLSNIDFKHLKQRVKLTRLAIDELGNVNLNAIDQFKEVQERFEFLSSQETDLLSAKANLEAIIKEMDETVTEKFMNTFNQVSETFKTIFKSLFGGGHGEIVLNSNDYLNAGIDIFVEPPGKKRQNLSLLSGGERALTAIVLLFSILKARSAPFVILDEVEAALDEANVLRFAKYLNTLKQDTQFIVITHRKGTMEQSDRLYGVTMQNSGISKLLSVNLKELNDEKVKELTE
ncbi:chromosome segregation protein SMC [Macrococcus sp. DPC7161]|uniref:chromosome segregation protein SMC n=1 Tax=Macrococcus sp. DPC7161 TaxID=2507060 RepID=UPI00100C2012|nr:chromosome segregation protein SMC [Macrococcus sp. DPC7161]RXK18961.1 chromosome segregation protein SMC [Macrococcus sp. DPC7161]